MLNEINRIRGLMTGNGAQLITALRTEGFYPSINPPVSNVPDTAVPSGFQIQLANPNASGTIYFTLDGADPRLPGGAVNPLAAAYAGLIPVSFSLIVRARVLNGSTWSALNEVVVISSNPPPLRITEIMYHPAPVSALELAADYTINNDFEYIKLQNVGSSELELNGALFTQGISFVFTNTVLAPGEIILLVKSQSAFTARHVTFTNIIGEFGGNLDNSGERVHLVDATGQTILDFTYNDAWQPLTDAYGHSLVIVNPLAEPATWNTPQAWRPSAQPDGSPGVTDPNLSVQSYALWVMDQFSAAEQADLEISGPEANPDNDPWSNFQEYGFVLNLKSADAAGASMVNLLSDQFGVTFTRLNFATDVLYQLEAGDNVNGPWRIGSAELTQEIVATTTLTHTVRVRPNQPASQNARQFLRFSVRPVAT